MTGSGLLVFAVLHDGGRSPKSGMMITQRALLCSGMESICPDHATWMHGLA